MRSTRTNIGTGSVEHRDGERWSIGMEQGEIGMQSVEHMGTDLERVLQDEDARAVERDRRGRDGRTPADGGRPLADGAERAARRGVEQIEIEAVVHVPVHGLFGVFSSSEGHEGEGGRGACKGRSRDKERRGL